MNLIPNGGDEDIREYREGLFMITDLYYGYV